MAPVQTLIILAQMVLKKDHLKTQDIQWHILGLRIKHRDQLYSFNFLLT